MIKFPPIDFSEKSNWTQEYREGFHVNNNYLEKKMLSQYAATENFTPVLSMEQKHYEVKMASTKDKTKNVFLSQKTASTSLIKSQIRNCLYNNRFVSTSLIKTQIQNCLYNNRLTLSSPPLRTERLKYS